MANDSMLKFVGREQAYPAKRAADDRAEDFREIAARYAPPAAEDQAGRCSQCGVPYCSVHCPLHNHIPDWLRLTAEGRVREAYELSNATSTMPPVRAVPLTTVPDGVRTCTIWPSPALVMALPSADTENPLPFDTRRTAWPCCTTGLLRSVSTRSGVPAASDTVGVRQ